MTIKEILDSKAIAVNLRSKDKKDAIGELVDLLVKTESSIDKAVIIKTLMDRENLGSTGIGQGIAIPHGKTEKIEKLVAAFGISKTGVNFDALDGEPVYIFFLLLAPKDSAGPHLKALARISRLLRDSFFCKQLRAAQTPDQIYHLLTSEEQKVY